MPTLTIRNIDTEVHSGLRMLAAKNGKSMEAEVRSILKHAVKHPTENPGLKARRIHERFAKVGGADDLLIPERETLAEPMDFSD